MTWLSLVTVQNSKIIGVTRTLHSFRLIMLLLPALCQEPKNREEGWKPSVTSLPSRRPQLFGLQLAVVYKTVAHTVLSMQHWRCQMPLDMQAACQIFTRVLTRVPAAWSHNQEWKLIMSFVWSATCIWQGSGSDHATSFGREAELPPCQAWAVLAVCLLPFSYFATGGRFSRAHSKTLILLTSQKISSLQPQQENTASSDL